MKKLFLFFALFAATTNMWAATTVTKTLSQLGFKDADDGKCFYTPIALDNVITVASVDGHAKYLKGNTPTMRYYQNTDKGYGSMIFKAKEGYVITAIKLKYSVPNSDNSVACVYWRNGNQRVPACDVLENDKARSFYSNQVVIYTGRTADGTGGQIRVSEYSVTYEQATLNRLYTKSTMDYVMQYNWSSGTCPLSTQNNTLQLNNVLTFKTDNNGNFKYWVNDRSMTCYKRSGTLKFEAHDGAIIKTIRIIYKQVSATNSLGVLIKPEDWGSDGNSIPSNKQIASNTKIAVNSTSVSFKVGNTLNNGTTQSSIQITGFQIEYTDGKTQMESFAKLNSTGSTSEVKYTGDNGIYKWKVKNFTHRDTCAMYDYAGVRLNYGGYIASDGNIEGGIKDASFEWRMSNEKGEDNNMTNPVKFSVKAGSITDNYTLTEQTTSAGHYMTYTKSFEAKSNCSFSINLGAKEATAQARPIVGPITITPYLLYTNKSVSIKAKDYASKNFKYTNAALINNTDAGTVSYAVSGDNANKIASIDAATGEVTILGAGTVTVTASWEQVTTTYQLTISLETPEIKFNDQTVNKKDTDASHKQVLTLVKPTEGNVTYSIVSGPASATIDADGTVHFSEAGTYVIKGVLAQTLPYKTDSATYTLNVTSLPVPSASFVESVVNKTHLAGAFKNPFTTESDGQVQYESGDATIASVNDTGLVSLTGRIGSTTITAKVAPTTTWAANSVSYTINVSAAPVADLHTLTISTDSLQKKYGFENNTNYTDIALNEVLTLSSCKYYTDDGGVLRYYQKYSPKFFTIQAKAGVIIQKVKFTYISRNNGTLAKSNAKSVAVADRYESGKTYAVDANSFTCYFGNTGTGEDGRADVTEFEITYFNPSTGVAVTKSANDLGKDLKLKNGTAYQNIAVNNVITLHADNSGTLKYYTSGNINCYRWTGPIEIKAREGATIHYVKITYNGAPNGTLTKYYGTDGKKIPASDRIASDSILYVNANSLKLWIGNTSGTDATVGITKIYVNYTDGEEVVVDNFDNCTSEGSEGEVEVAGVDSKYDWTFTNFSRKDSITNRMYYDQSVLINKGGKISTQYTGGLKELAFDWHPSEKSKAVKFYVIAGGETITVDSAAMADKYTINFNKQNIKSNGEFAIAVDGQSATTLEVGHVSLTPYIIYTDREVTIAAKDYKDAGWKYTNNTLTNYTGQDVTYSITDGAGIASINSATGEVTILGGGTVTVNATADDVTASYQLTISLEATEVEFAETAVAKLLSVGSYTQKLTLTTAPESGNTVTYSFVGDHDGATLEDSTVTFTKAGIFTIKGKLEQNLPYAADSASYTLTVNKDLATPEMNFVKDSMSVYLNADPFTNELTVTKGDGAISYESGDTNIATVDNDGLVTIVGAGTTTITANSAATEAYLAGSVNYSLTVSPLKLPTAAYTMDVVNKNQNDAAFTNTTLETESDGKKTYESSNPSVATVNDTTGEVTMGVKPGTTIITVKIAASETWEKIEASYTLNVSSAPLADMKITTGNVPQLATQYSWNNDNCYTYFKLDDNISISSTDGNAKYLKVGNENCLRYYHKQGTFTIRAKAGVIIKAVKFNYYAQNDGVIASAINGTATEVPADKQLLSGVTYPVDGSVLTFYAASTSTKTGSSTQVRITDFEITYFDPSEGVAVTKSANDLAKDLKLKNNTPYQNIAVNNVITLHADANNTMKYYTTGNINCYRWTGPIEIKAREGATIHYVKITYSGGPRATLTKYYGKDGKNIPASDRIASDSILYVNANSLRLYVGDTLNDKTTSPTLGITKIYVNYTDKSEAIVENFDNCNTITTTGSVDVKGVDSTYDWKITNFTRDSVRRIYYDQSIMLRTKYGQSKIETVGTEGGYKEISFDWFPTTASNATQFTVKAGDMTDVVDSAAMGSSYKITYTKTGIKSNGAFSIEIAADQAKSYVEFGHISLTPYLLYTTKSASVNVGDTYTNSDIIDNRDNQDAITYSSDDETVATVDSTGKVTALKLGTATIKAKWGDVWTSYTVNVNGIFISEEDSVLESKLAAGEVNVTLKRVMRGGMYNTIYLPFAMDENQVETAFGENTVIAAFTDAQLEGIRLTLTFDTTVTTLEARTPYLIKPMQDINDPVNVGNVTIVKENNEIQHGDATLMGVIPQSTIDISLYYFLMADNTLKYYTTSIMKKMNGLRAFFQINSENPVQARCVMMGEGRGQATELPVVNGEIIEGTQKMIIDSRLVIIRDGKMYDAQGALIK